MGIKLKQNLTWLFILTVVLLSGKDNLCSQEVQQKPSRQAAMEAFSKGDYEKAFKEFNILLESYSKDPLYKYYSGVCLVKMNMDPESARILLQDALNGSLDIKSIPDDAWFYLGRSQQMAGMYPDAIRSYNNFENKAGRNKARDLNISAYIQECNEGRGRLKESEYKKASDLIKAGQESKESGQKIAAVKTVKQSAEKPVPQKEKVPDDYDKVLSQAMDYQVKADSINSLISEYKKEYERVPASQKQAAKTRISELELLAADYQKLADEKFGNAGVKTTPRTQIIEKTQVPEVQNAKGIYSLFYVETNPIKVKEQKISVDPELPEGLIYRIQIGVFSKPLEPSFFKGISPVTGFKVPGTLAIKYFVGMFRTIADASRSLLTVKQLGFKDAFVNAILDGKPVSNERALLLEKEWSQKSLIKITSSQKTEETKPSTLVFRVEVKRSDKPVDDATADSYKKMAGNRGFEMLSTEDGTFVYLIGKFITFDSANEYSDLLNRNGYREAKVVAYIGNKEVPLDTAKKLFEK